MVPPAPVNAAVVPVGAALVPNLYTLRKRNNEDLIEAGLGVISSAMHSPSLLPWIRIQHKKEHPLSRWFREGGCFFTVFTG